LPLTAALPLVAAASNDERQASVGRWWDGKDLLQISIATSGDAFELRQKFEE